MNVENDGAALPAPGEDDFRLYRDEVEVARIVWREHGERWDIISPDGYLMDAASDLSAAHRIISEHLRGDPRFCIVRLSGHFVECVGADIGFVYSRGETSAPPSGIALYFKDRQQWLGYSAGVDGWISDRFLDVDRSLRGLSVGEVME